MMSQNLSELKPSYRPNTQTRQADLFHSDFFGDLVAEEPVVTNTGG